MVRMILMMMMVMMTLMVKIESLKDFFEGRTSTGSEVFSLTICLDAKKFVLISFFSLIRTIYLRVSTKPPPNDAKRPLPVDVLRSKTLLLKLPNSRRRLRKLHLQSEVALLQTSSRLFHHVQFVKCWQFFLELNSKRV